MWPNAIRHPAFVPLVLFLVVVIATSANLSGSSVALYSPPKSQGIVFGQPRPGRSDEWFVRTAYIKAQYERDFAAENDVVGVHDVSIIYDLPTRDWTTLLKPHLLGYLVLDFSHGIAFEWWLRLWMAFTAIYALLVVAGVRTSIATVAGLLFVFAPVVQWWTIWISTMAPAYGVGAAAMGIAALRANSNVWRCVLAAGAGFLAACLVEVFYPPWIVPIGILAGSLVVAALTSARPLRRIALPTTIGLGTAAVLVVAALLSHRTAVRDVGQTITPGQRRVASGGGDTAVLASAPFNALVTGRQSTTVKGTNTTETASGLLLLLPVAMYCLAAGRSLVGALVRTWRILLGVLFASAVMFAWFYLRLPTVIGRVTFLDRVPAGRMYLPLAVASVLAFALLLEWIARRGVDRFAAVVAAASFGALTWWSGSTLVINDRPIPLRYVVLLSVLFTAAIAVALVKPRTWLVWGIVVLLGSSAIMVNPLQRGMAALDDHPLLQDVRRLRSSRDVSGRWAMFGSDPLLVGALAGSGVPAISGMSFYPDHDFWAIVDPTGQYEPIWNRYAWVALLPAPAVTPSVGMVQGDFIAINLDPCGELMRSLDVGGVVSDQPLTGYCLEELPASSSTYHLYRRSSEPPP